MRSVWRLTVLAFLVEYVCSDNVTDFRVHLEPEGGLELISEEVITVDGFLELDQPISKDRVQSKDLIHLEIPNSAVARILDNSTSVHQHIWCQTAKLCLNVTFQVQGVFLGRTKVIFYLGDKSDDRFVLPVKYPIKVVRTSNPLSNIFLYSIAAIVAINNIGFGCTIDLQKIKELLKRPIPLIIGLCCQFIINPLIAYGSGKLFGLAPALALGLFAFGCSPGGGNSNLWSLVLDGDVDLSILITFTSIITAFGMVPLWMYLLGRSLGSENVQIPFSNMFIALSSIMLPLLLGLVLRRFLPKLAAFIRKIFKPVSIIVVILIIPLAIYTNLYVFYMMRDWRIVGSALLLPYSAFTLSSTISYICRQPRARILTISIETAIQNMAIAIVMILSSLPSPEGDLASAMPITAAVFTPIPLFVLLFIKLCRRRCCSKDSSIKEKHSEDSPKYNPTGNDIKDSPRESKPKNDPKEIDTKEIPS